MRILFLDDNSERRKVFGQKSIGCVVDFAVNADEAVVFLGSENKYDLIMLDHDLGGPEEEGRLIEGAKDGRFVARFMAEKHPKHQDAFIVVHSLNGSGAVQMEMILCEAGFTPWVMPFAWRKFYLQENGTAVFKDSKEHEHQATPGEIDILTDE